MTLVSRFKLEFIGFYTSCSQSVIGTYNAGMTSEGYDSLSLIGGKIFKINEAEVIFSHCFKHLQVMSLFLGNMTEEEIGFSGNKSPFIHLFHAKKPVSYTHLRAHETV